MDAIITQNITKKFNDLVAVNNVNLNVKDGEIFGLLGPNGAGKTTLISILVTMKKQTEGKAIINGFDVSEKPDDVRKSIGIVFQDPSLDEDLTAYENLDIHAAMYRVERNERKSKIEEVLEIVELKDRMNDVVKTFSGGMRRRLEIARSLLHCPKVLFLDEPTIGLDPQTRKHVWEYVKKLKEEFGMTILLTTHYMDEADQYADRIAIIDQGKIIAQGTPTELKNTLGGDHITIETKEKEKFEALLKKEKWVKNIQVKESIIILVEKAEKRIPEIMKIADANSIAIDSISLRKPTLDDVFLHYTGHGIRDEEINSKESFKMHRRAWGAGTRR